ncbi:MAG: acyl-CoA desaturase [Phycisphaeraceae bacterium]
MTAANMPHSAPQPSGRPKFVGDKAFQVELHRRIAEFFRQTGRRERDCPPMYVKTVILLTLFFGLYVLLVFFAQTWWQALSLAILLGLATAGIGLDVQHDGGHHGYSTRPWINKLMAMTLDLIGGSSYVWHYRHTVLHHTYVNITGHDTDIDLGALGRVTPYQKRLKIHRWQHYYMWPLYGLMAIRWQIFGDYLDVIRGRIGEHPIPRPRGWDLALFIGGKLTFLALALSLPMIFHSWWIVLIFYAVAGMTAGITLSVVFQLAHTVEEAEFVAPTEANLVENAWAIHQVESTVDFTRRSRVAAWLLGGLNYQIEHHLFPRICHVNYPAMSPIVEQACQDFGVKYHAHPTFWAGIASHFRWLRKMGAPEVASAGGG